MIEALHPKTIWKVHPLKGEKSRPRVGKLQTAGQSQSASFFCMWIKFYCPNTITLIHFCTVFGNFQVKTAELHSWPSTEHIYWLLGETMHTHQDYLCNNRIDRSSKLFQGQDAFYRGTSLLILLWHSSFTSYISDLLFLYISQEHSLCGKFCYSLAEWSLVGFSPV